jgi:hypothetical protein
VLRPAQRLDLDGTSSGEPIGGHLMAQVAACRRGVGVARARRLRLLELRGAGRDLEDLARRLTGRVPVAADGCVRMRCGWWRSTSAQRVLILADPVQIDPFDRLLGPALSARSDVAVQDRSDHHAGLLLTGAHAARCAAGPAIRLIAPVLAAADGDQHHLLVVPRSRADDAWQVLLDAGRRYGAVAVDVAAVELHRASAPATQAGAAPIPLRPLSVNIVQTSLEQ